MKRRRGTSATSEIQGDEENKDVRELRAKKMRTRGRSLVKANTATEKAWPEYFHSLFKVFKAINTVLAFVSSRKHLATTFPVVRSSIENLLKHPLEIISVAELKALLPDIITFSYIPKHELQISNGESEENELLGTSLAGPLHSNLSENETEEGHVLVLELADNLKGKKTKNVGFGYSVPTLLTPVAMKKLVESRNERFELAINELLAAISEGDDPVTLLKEAGRDYIPVNPSTSQCKVMKTFATVPEAFERLSVNDVINELKNQEWYKDQIVHRKTFEGKKAQTLMFETGLSENIKQALTSRNISSFYSHQVAAIQALGKGSNVIVATSTASGKSMIYQVPVLTYIEQNRSATAVFVYPTKALAQDQRASLEHLISCCPGLDNVKVATYDGDTPQEERKWIRETSSVIFTNFDTIHMSILPHEDQWRSFLKNLKLFAVDELHYYSGLFGSHVAMIIRRFRRVCAAVGNRRARFVSCTATITSPGEYMQKIFGLAADDIEVFSQDGAPSSPKTFLVWNPPFVDEMDPSLGRHSSISEATKLFMFLMKRGIRVILFCKIRKVCELAMKAVRTQLGSEGRYDILDRVKPYRGGYSQEDRRQIEKEAFSGRLLGVVATNALELGVDIGTLDAVIMLGFPMTISSFRQQAGRAGRRSSESLAVYVPDPFPIDQFYTKHPEELFDQPPNELIIELENEVLLEGHLQCAAHEMPISNEDKTYFGPLMRRVCEARLRKDKDGWFHTHPNFLPFPSRHISIRGAREEKYIVIEIREEGKTYDNIVLEEVEVSRSMFEIYEGGIFMHQGRTYIVKEVNHDAKLAKVIRSDVNYITSPRDFTNVDALQTYRIRAINESRAYYGKVNIFVKVFGYFKIRNNVILDAVDVDTPPWDCETVGFWIDVPKSILDFLRLKQIHPAEAIHAAEHAVLNQFSLAEDVRTECKASEKEYRVTESGRKRPARLIFYDPVGKGGGITVKAFDIAQELLAKAHKAIEKCECEDGCAKCCVVIIYLCVQSNVCSEKNEVSSKIGALLIIKGILGLTINTDAIPVQQGQKLPDTIIEALPISIAKGNVIEITG